ncbi:MAG: DNA adenine methylase [Ktedonobacteraceae bacterium]|nr:DNA adenine methylase [Ktedonobacteraceae bacterium]
MLVRTQPSQHLEVYNDLNSDLVCFWMAARDQPEALLQRIETLPYSRSLYYAYRKSLHEPMDDLERAARWFYLLRSTFGGVPDFSKGWGYTIGRSNSRAHSIRTATALLSLVAQRFRCVQIEHQDFASIIQTYQTPRTLFYVDPPYVGCEDYYNESDGTSLFTDNDHHRLATLLNATPALVAVSYYEHPVLSELYPVSCWRRITWMQAKAVERTRASRQYGHEVLLMNYPAALGLWETAQ